MANITRTLYLSLPPANTGRSDIAYALEGNSFSTSGVSESATIPGTYKVSVTYDSALNSAIGWRIPISGGGYYYATEDIYPGSVSTITDKTGFKLASDGLDSVIVEPAVGAGVAVNARQALAVAASRSVGKWSRDPNTGNATFYAAGNPTVTRLVFAETVNAVTVTLTLPT